MITWLTKRRALAAWVQAAGSIFAILIAVWVADIQRADQLQTEARAKRDQEIIVISAVLTFTEWVKAMSIETKRDIRRLAFGEIKRLDPKEERFHQAELPIQSIPIHVFGSVETMNAAYLALQASRTLYTTREQEVLNNADSSQLLDLSNIAEDLEATLNEPILELRTRLKNLQRMQ